MTRLIALILLAASAAAAQAVVTLSAASFSGTVAPDSIASAFGSSLAVRIQAATTVPLPTALAGTTVRVIDSSGADRLAPLYFVSPGQVNFLIPAGTAAGQARIIVRNEEGHTASGTVNVERVAPGLFTANTNGQGTAAAIAVMASRRRLTFDCGTTPGNCLPLPLDLSADTVVELYGTGIRGRTAVAATVDGASAAVLFAGPQNQYPGLDQVNIGLPRALAGRGLVELRLTVDGKPANRVSLLLAPEPAASPVAARFDPSSPDIGPFPTDFLTSAGRVNLPLPDCTHQPSTCEELALLNQLDGFNLQPRVQVRFSAPVDTGSLQEGIRIFWQEPGRRPVGHLTRLNQLVFDPAANTAYGKPDEPLDQQRRYLLIATDALRDRAGNSVTADPAFSTCIQSRPNDYCARLAQAVSSAAALVAPRRIIAASLFTTLNATAWLEAARRALDTSPPNVRRAALFDLSRVLAVTVRLQERSDSTELRDFTLPLTGLFTGGGRLAFGSYQSPSFLNEQQVIPPGAPRTSGSNVISFHAILPGTGAPANGYPVVIFGHGLNDSRFGAPTLVASALTREGFAMLAINAVGHGSGAGSRVVVTELGRQTDLPAGGRSLDLNRDGRIESREGCLILSGAPIALRDCLRQTAVDLMQLIRAIRGGIDLDGDGRADLDSTRVYYAGQSLGALYGTLLTAVDPDVRAAVLNVGGASVVDIARWSPSFESLARDLLAARRPPLLNAGNDFNENYVLRDRPAKINDVAGAIEIQNLLERMEWLHAIGDPIAFAPHLVSSPLAGLLPKRVLVQFAKGDRTVPNPATSTLIRQAGLFDNCVLYRHDLARQASFGLSENPHAYLVDIRSPAGLAIAAAAQAQLAGFLKSDGTAIPDANSPALRLLLGADIFEKPALLPEDLYF